MFSLDFITILKQNFPFCESQTLLWNAPKHFWSLVQYLHFFWKFDVFVDLSPPKNGSDVGSLWQMSIVRPRRTIWHLKSDKIWNLTFLVTFDPEERVGSRGHHDNFWSFGRDVEFEFQHLLSKSDEVDKLIFLITFDREERVGQRRYHKHSLSLVQYLQYDIPAV